MKTNYLRSKFSRNNARRTCCLAGALTLMLTTSSALALPVARLKNVRPTVMVRAQKAQVFSAARERQSLSLGDFVRTNSSGKAFIVFSNGTSVTMKPNSTVQLVAPSSPQKSLGIRVMGTFSEVFVQPKGGTEVYTAAGTAAARGTSFLVQLPDDNTTVVTVLEDTVEFYNPQGRVLVNAGQQSTAKVGQAPTPPVAVDAAGLTQWTLDVSGLPVEFEFPNITLQLDTPPTATPNPRLLAAQSLLVRGEYSQAAQSFREVAILTPNDAQAQFGLGQALRQSGDIPGAITAFRAAQKLAPDNVLPRVGLALAHLSQNDATTAKNLLEEHQAEKPAALREAALGEAVLGLIALRGGQNELAVTHLLSAIEQDGSLYQARALLALAYLSQNQLAPAENAARSAVRLQPASAQAQSTLAMALFFQGQTKPAAQAAQRAVELNPFSPLSLLTYGRAMLAQQKNGEALQALNQAEALAPDLPIVLEDLGSVYLRLDQPRRAEHILRRALAIQPDSPGVRTRLGVALQQQGKTDEAEAMQRAVLQTDPQNPAARANLASLLIEEGRFDDAETVLGTPDEADDRPEYGSVYIRLSELMLFRGQLLQAQEYARRAVRLLPGSAPAHYQLGRVYLEQGRATQAEAQFRQAATLDKDFPEARYALGFARGQAESGLLATPGLSGGALSLGSPATGLDLQTNLQTPGAADRIQAALIDPSVVRVASRSLGDTEIEGLFGANSTDRLKLSHLRERGDRRGVLGLVGSRETTDGPVANADRNLENYSFIFGQKGKDNPRSVLLLAEYRNESRGFGAETFLGPFAATSRENTRTPLALIGAHFPHGTNGRTRALLQYAAPKSDTIVPVGQGTQSLDDLNFELRHDRHLRDRHLLSAGLNIGRRERNTQDTAQFPMPPPAPASMFVSDITNDFKMWSVYLRDEFRLNSQWTLISELEARHIDTGSQFNAAIDGIAQPAMSFTAKTTRLLPAFIADYRMNPRKGVRLRARRLMGGIEDFRLLAPRDLFLFSTSDLLQPVIYDPAQVRFGSGFSYEAEYDQTFGNGALLRLGLFRQSITGADQPLAASSLPLNKAHVYGARLGLEGVLNRQTTYFLNLGINQSSGRLSSSFPPSPPEEELANVPNFVAALGLQYLNDSGYFVQPTYFYLDERFRIGTPFPGGPPRTIAGGAHLLNLRIGKRWGVRSVLFVEAANLLDEDYEVFEITQSSRQLRLGGQFRF